MDDHTRSVDNLSGGGLPEGPGPALDFLDEGLEGGRGSTGGNAFAGGLEGVSGEGDEGAVGEDLGEGLGLLGGEYFVDAREFPVLVVVRGYHSDSVSRF